MRSISRSSVLTLALGVLALGGCTNNLLTTSLACPLEGTGSTCGIDNPRPIRCVCVTSTNLNPDASIGSQANPCPSVGAIAPPTCVTVTGMMTQAWQCPSGSGFTTMPDPCPPTSVVVDSAVPTDATAPDVVTGG